jgi:cytidylate kinase
MHVDNLSLSVAEALLRSFHPEHRRAADELVERRHGVIAISRESGAQGETVAREVGQRLGCPVYNREIVETVAATLRRPVAELRRFDERPTFWVEDWATGLGRQAAIGADTYVKYLMATVRGMAEMGPCVLVGRGAARILAPETTLRVRLIADRADRIKVAQDLHHLSRPEAVEWLDRTEQERTAFIRRNFSVDPAEPHLYDLILNTSHLAVGECAEIIVEAFVHLESRIAHKALVVSS